MFCLESNSWSLLPESGISLRLQELEAVGGGPELDKMCAAATAIAKHSGPTRDC